MTRAEERDVGDHIDDVLNHLFDFVNMSMTDLLVLADSRYRHAWNSIEKSNKMFSLLNSAIFWPLTILYAAYVRFPLLVMGHLSRHAVVFLQISSRRSRLFRELLVHICALIRIGMTIFVFCFLFLVTFVLYSIYDISENCHNQDFGFS
jgi:hypothetical protein